MRRRFAAAVVLSCAMAISASAQTAVPGAGQGRGTPTPPSGPPPSIPQVPDTPRGGSAPAEPRSAPAPEAQATAKADLVSLTGCVARSDVPGGSPEGVFRLTNVRSTAPGGGRNSDTSGARESAPPAVGAMARANAYALTADEGVVFAPHVGHLVTVTGVLAARGGTASDPSRDPTGTVGASSSESSRGAERDGVVTRADATTAAAPVLRVSALKMVSATCPAP